MKRFLLLLIAICQLLFAAGLAAQTITTVTGTVTDPSGVPYGNGTIIPQFVNVSGGASPTITATGAPLFPPVTPTTLSRTGTFSIAVMANGSISPTGSNWQFQICSPPLQQFPNVLLSSGQCFTTGLVTIAGSTQDITTNINAVSPPSLLAANVAFALSVGGSGLNQSTAQTVLTKGTGIAPLTSQAQTPITINGLTNLSQCDASLPSPLPPSWQTGVQILGVVASTNTATVWLSNGSSNIVTPIASAISVRCFL